MGKNNTVKNKKQVKNKTIKIKQQIGGAIEITHFFTDKISIEYFSKCGAIHDDKTVDAIERCLYKSKNAIYKKVISEFANTKPIENEFYDASLEFKYIFEANDTNSNYMLAYEVLFFRQHLIYCLLRSNKINKITEFSLQYL